VELGALDHVGLVVSDMSRSVHWYQEAELRARGLPFQEADYGVAWSVHLPDPDGYQVEITTYEPASA
jgi:glyoxalase/bleomycin resistance protein/dioxygenase superfamily protein